MQRTGGVLLDTGVLVALLLRDDARHGAAMGWLGRCTSKIHTTEAVLTEACHFLPSFMRGAVADFAAGGQVQLHHPDTAGIKRIGALLRKYADVDPDWADTTLIWLAEVAGIHNIATLDMRDFSTYRIHGRSKFLIEPIA